MAARTRKIQIDKEWRQRIKTGVLMDCLQKHVVGKNKMTNSQVRAAEILLRKVVPDLSSTTVSGDADNPLVVEHSNAVDALLSLPSLRARNTGAPGEDSETIQ